MLLRAPTLGEIGDMLFGDPSTTRLSDHPGYLTTLRIQPRSTSVGGVR